MKYLRRGVVLTSGARPTSAGRANRDPDCCPFCSKKIGGATTGLRRSHKDRWGSPCSGSGLRVVDVPTVDLAELPPVRVPSRGGKRGVRANPWSGKASP